MTEAEAKTKWCPFARSTVRITNELRGPVALTSANRWQETEDGPESGSLCLGSVCMVWRWDDAITLGVNRDGHCGLAGKTEWSK